MPFAYRVMSVLVCLALSTSASSASAARGGGRRPGSAKVAAHEADPLTVAAAEREALAAKAAELDAIQSVEATARWLSGEAWSSQDPWVHLMAARTWLKVQRGRTGLDRAEFHAREAIALAEAPPVPRISAADVARVQADAAAVQAVVAERRAELRHARAERRAAERWLRRGRGELIAGGAMMAVATLGAGLALGGADYRRRFHDSVAPVLGSELPLELAPLRGLETQGRQMIAAGAVLTAVGVAAGVPLLILGARDVRAGQRQRGRASLQLQPGLGELRLVGRL